MQSEKKVSTEKYDKWIKEWKDFHDANPDYKKRYGSVFVEMSLASIQDQIAALLYATRKIPESVDIEYIALWGALAEVDYTDDIRKRQLRDNETVFLKVDFLKPKIKGEEPSKTEVEVTKNYV